jgi:hypothetical protein
VTVCWSDPTTLFASAATKSAAHPALRHGLGRNQPQTLCFLVCACNKVRLSVVLTKILAANWTSTRSILRYDALTKSTTNSITIWLGCQTWRSNAKFGCHLSNSSNRGIASTECKMVTSRNVSISHFSVTSAKHFFASKTSRSIARHAISYQSSQRHLKTKSMFQSLKTWLTWLTVKWNQKSMDSF